MATAATIVAVLQLADGDYNSKLKQAERTAAGFAAKAGQSFVKAGKAFTVGLTVPIVAGMTKSVLAAGDLEQATGAVDVVFGDLADTIHEFAETSAESAGLAKSDFKQLATEAGALLLNLGLPLDETAEKTTELALRAADMAAVYNTDVTDAMEAIQAGLRGMGRPLLAYGVNLDAAAVKAKALEMGLGGVDRELTTQEESYARLAIIMEQTNLIQGHFNKEAETMDGQMKRLKANFKDTAAELGTHLLPYVTDFLKLANQMVLKFQDLSGEQQVNLLKWAGLAAAIGPTLLVLGKILIIIPKLKAGWGTLNSMMSIVGGTATGLVGTLGVLAIALAAVIAGYAKQAKVRKETIQGQKDLANEIANTSESYSEYINRVNIANADVKKLEKVTGGYGYQLAQNGMYLDFMTEEEWMAARGMGELGDATDEALGTMEDWNEEVYRAGYNLPTVTEAADNAAQAAANYYDYVDLATAGTEDWNSSLYDMRAVSDSAFGDIVNRAVELTQAQESIAEYQEEINALMLIEGGGYYDGVWMSAREVEEKLGDVKGEIASVEEQMQRAANQMVLDMLMVAITADGIVTGDEMDAYFDMAVKFGIVSREAADQAITEYDRAMDYIEGNPITPRVDTTSVIDEINRLKQENITIPVTFVNTNDYQQRALGGEVYANTPYIVGERGPELFVPKGDGEIIPNDQLGGGNTYVLNMNSSANPQDVVTAFELLEAYGD